MFRHLEAAAHLKLTGFHVGQISFNQLLTDSFSCNMYRALWKQTVWWMCVCVWLLVTQLQSGRCFSPLSSLCLTLVEAAGIFSLQDLVPSFTSWLELKSQVLTLKWNWLNRSRLCSINGSRLKRVFESYYVMNNYVEDSKKLTFMSDLW